MICIYCHQDSGLNPGLAHIFPEALGANDKVLPRGTVCDGCNQYLGKRLDENLVRYPSIAFAIQYLASPGKKGKPRKRIGGIDREISDNPEALLQAIIDQPTITTGRDGVRRAHVQLQPDPQLQMSRFRRALHHVAFNVVAGLEGPEHMLQAQWEPARMYIRFPQSESEAWPYAQVSPQPGSIPRAVQGVRWESGRREIVTLQIFQTMFTVDLANAGDLETLATEQQFEFVHSKQEQPLPMAFDLLLEDLV